MTTLLRHRKTGKERKNCIGSMRSEMEMGKWEVKRETRNGKMCFVEAETET